MILNTSVDWMYSVVQVKRNGAAIIFNFQLSRASGIFFKLIVAIYSFLFYLIGPRHQLNGFSHRLLLTGSSFWILTTFYRLLNENLGHSRFGANLDERHFENYKINGKFVTNGLLSWLQINSDWLILSYNHCYQFWIFIQNSCISSDCFYSSVFFPTY